MIPNPPYYISLGAGRNQQPLIEAAIREGFAVIGIDASIEAPGYPLCDLFIQEDILNYRKIHKKLMLLMLDRDIAGGYCASYGAALVSWAFLAERFNLPSLSRTQTESLQDKLHVRRQLSKQKDDSLFRQPAFLGLEQRISKSTLEELGYPIIIKSRFGAGKKNIFEAADYHDVKEILSSSHLKMAGLDPREIILEEKIEGNEITVTGLVENFRFHPVAITDKQVSARAPFIELEHTYPSIYHEKLPELTAIHQEIVNLLDIPSTPVVSEWKVRNDVFYLVEISAQIPGENLAGFLIPQAVKYDFFANLVRITAGKPLEPLLQKKKPRRGRVRYWQSRPTPDEIAEARQKAAFFSILNEKPANPPRSNADRSAVAGYLE